MAFCDYCFRDKSPLQPVLPGASVTVCKGCAYQIERVIGFLVHSGFSIVKQGELTPLTPHRKRGSKAKTSPQATKSTTEAIDEVLRDKLHKKA